MEKKIYTIEDIKDYIIKSGPYFNSVLLSYIDEEGEEYTSSFSPDEAVKMLNAGCNCYLG